ncbi:ABC transporter substrate-binding protein [Cryobacterium sp. TMT1-21]|uniref:ABC transporter substrate-binding protein n=1 Tax=unclassified Cryobacterium TaxID=2649013 RepID=UPI00106D2FDE|nr:MULTISPECIES: ABC transporter substrate-binding protein [unclassified Cryobacterium]TFD14074.1 ABC transporter substrate-binding protein [Cryobacterium sp. TMT4-10]TFD17654.1 ABC transporter substrate-binding protein [Cryobacterium sp. TMT1-21]TFD36236.1 ABC transporter substrate-binding protein [Cryobacterium sp. TMT2-10]
MKKSRLRFIAPIAVVTALALAGCSTSNLGGTADADPAAEAEPIKIGAVLDVTGVGASLGVPEQNTLTMLAKQLNADGGIDGRDVELTIVDNQSTEDGAAKATSKLIESDKVDLIIGASRTGPSLAMRPIAEAAKVPMISVAANIAIVEGSQWVFKTAQNDVVVIERILDDAKAKGYTKLALVRDATGFGEGVADYITKLGAERGITLVMTEAFEPSATDFTPQMTNVRGSDADAVIIWGINPSAGLAQKAYVQLGVNKPVYHSHGISNQAFFDAAGDAANGVIAPMGRLLVADQLAADNPQSTVIDQFKADYSKAYSEQPSGFAGHAFDAWHIAVNAIDAVGTDPEALRTELETAKWTGISGVFKMTAKNHSGLDASALILAEAEDGRWNLLKD